MDRRTPRRVRFGLPQDLPCHRGDIAFTKQDIAQRIQEGIAFRPAEVGVWDLAGPVACVQQEGGKRVGDGRTFGPQDSVAADLDTRHPQDILKL